MPRSPTPIRPARCARISSRRANCSREAGWTYRDGALRNAKGEPFVFEILDDTGGGASMEPVAAAFGRNLQKLGITMNFRTVDYALIQKRLDAFDFDMTSVRMPDVQVPGTEQVSRFGSKSADEQGSDNLAGVKSPAVDAILQKVMSRADARAARRRHARARSRADERLLCGAALVLGDASRGVSQYARRIPSTLPLYYGAEEWVISTWWAKAAPAAK